MKRALRIGGAVLLIGAAVWLLRAIYLYRVWTMATIWYGSAPMNVSFLTCLSPQMQATTAHGVYADTTFLRIPAHDTVAIQGTTPIAVPLKIPDKSDCQGPAMRFDPHSMPLEDYQPCYRTPSWFATYATEKGEAYRSETDSTGGFVLRDDAHGVVYVAAYRTYPRPK